MTTRDEFLDVGAAVARSVRHDETGNLHQFYAYDIPDSPEKILRLAAEVSKANKKVFEQKDRMAAALAGMQELRNFFWSECDTQSTPGPNRGGKTQARVQKLVAIAVGRDPTRPDYRFPFDTSQSPLVIWSCVPARNTRTELMDLQRRVPPGVRCKPYTAKGDERLEFEPTRDRPKGAIIRIKSYSMPVDQFQREAVHVIAMDEKCPPYIWDECRMRLLSTRGWMILAMALYDLELWLYEKNYKFAKHLRGQMTGLYGWYSWTQRNCPWLDQGRVEAEAEHLSEDARAARVEGEPRLLEGSAYFKPVEMVQDLWKKFSRNPEWELRFHFDGKPEYRTYGQRKGWRIYERPVAGATYAIGADVAEGLGGDHDSSTIHVIRIDTNTVVAVFQSNEIEADDFGVEIYLCGKLYNEAIIAVEVNVERAATHHWLKKNGYPRIYRRMSFGGKADPMQDSLGWYTDSRSKNWMMEELRQSLKATRDGKRGELVLYDAPTYEEISDFGFLREPRRRSHGLGGLSGHDDLVVSLAIALQATKQAERPRTVGIPDVIENSLDSRISKIVERQQKQARRLERGGKIRW